MQYTSVSANAEGTIAQLKADITRDAALSQTGAEVQALVAEREQNYAELHDLASIRHEARLRHPNAPVAYLVGHVLTESLAPHEEEDVVRPFYVGLQVTGEEASTQGGVSLRERLAIETYVGVFDYETDALPHTTTLVVASRAGRMMIGAAHGIANRTPKEFMLKSLVAPGQGPALLTDREDLNPYIIPPAAKIKRDLAKLTAYKAVLGDQAKQMADALAMINRPQELIDAVPKK